ncbi:AraC family transcriptional regulator [Paenibacillus senegalensis]|uniref:AraC family transcriptional regulator n=1 Tax=Paenibacillus senegalensis TaxID=1465766 RepID=UPI000287EA8A|nr:AraC family transcriptional regulator [Paenibacillus senegalensis]
MQPSTHEVAVNPYPEAGEVTVLFAGNAQTPPLHKVGPQVLDYYLIHYIQSGKGVFRCRGTEYVLTPGSSFVIFPGELVSYVSDEQEPWAYRWIGFKGSKVDQMLSQIQLSPVRPIGAGHQSSMPVWFRRAEKALREGESGCSWQAEAFFKLILAEYARNHRVFPVGQSRKDPLEIQVDQAIRWLSLQYSQPITIDMMAKALGYHRSYLSKIFKQYTGKSPSHYLLKIRMERARILLKEPLTIEQVASSVGFSDALYFSKQFRKWYGSSPTQYRELTADPAYDCQFDAGGW